MELKSQFNQFKAPYYTRQNLALVLGKNRRTLDARLASLQKQSILVRLKPGFYLNKQLLDSTNQKNQMLEYVGSMLKYPAYLSLEYMLAQHGLIPESIYSLTYVTSKKTGQFDTQVGRFSYRKIKESLFTGYQMRQFGGLSYNVATKAKALFDFFYFTPISNYTRGFFRQLLFSSRINWQNFSKKDLDEFGLFAQNSNLKKMSLMAQIMKQEFLK